MKDGKKNRTKGGKRKEEKPPHANQYISSCHHRSQLINQAADSAAGFWLGAPWENSVGDDDDDDDVVKAPGDCLTSLSVNSQSLSVCMCVCLYVCPPVEFLCVFFLPYISTTVYSFRGEIGIRKQALDDFISNPVFWGGFRNVPLREAKPPG